MSGATILFLVPLYKFDLPSNAITYVFLGLACAFFALSDRMYTASYKELDVSVYSFLSQLSAIFIFGIIFFREEVVFKRVIGALLILIANVFVLYKKKRIVWNKYYLYNIIANLSFAIGMSFNVGISDLFNLPFYIAITLCSSSILIFFFEHIKFKDVIDEYRNGNKKAIIIVSLLDGITSLFLLRAYKLGSVTLVAPLCFLKTVLNVIVARLFLRENDLILKKIIAALIIIIGIILINC